MIRDFDMIRSRYSEIDERLAAARTIFNRPLTYAEKILITHMAAPITEVPEAGNSYVMLNPDRVAMQDATAQMALLQFMQSGRKEAAVPSTVHCEQTSQPRSVNLNFYQNAFSLR